MTENIEQLERADAPELNRILGTPIRVLDDGFVRVIDYMGNDSSIVQAARVSYGKGTKKMREDEGLIRYLMRHHHTSPLEMCEIKLHLRVPMDCWRQWIRHRTASINEYSTRYSVAIDSAQKTGPDRWRLQATSNRQGSEGFLDPEKGKIFSKKESELHELARRIYNERLEAGLAREQARKDLPLSTYTEAYWKIDLHNLLHFLALRMEMHAQSEIRAYADTIGSEIVSKWCPLVWKAFMDYEFGVLELSSQEIEIIARLQSGDKEGATALAVEFGLLRMEGENIKPCLELEEMEQNLKRLCIHPPWRK
jgi:thymidylate synthase (FAD)